MEKNISFLAIDVYTTGLRIKAQSFLYRFGITNQNKSAGAIDYFSSTVTYSVLHYTHVVVNQLTDLAESLAIDTRRKESVY